jgi:Response regulator containing a CheY-like receiver domain and an HD-GYP domain
LPRRARRAGRLRGARAWAARRPRAAGEARHGNASSYEGLERTFVSTVEALANALEANDEYTSAHARWITDLSLRVGRELGLDERTLKRLELGALLHDIGKIGIPSDVLAKPGG